MKTTKFLIGTLLAMSIFTSCEKKSSQIIDDDCDGDCNLVAYNSMEEFFEVNGVQNQAYTYTAEDGGVIIGENGTKITIPVNAFEDKDGILVTGDVDVKLKEIFSPSEMILSNRPTNATDNSGTNTFLLSEGETEIIAEQNGEELNVVSGKLLNISVPAAEDFDSSMKPFTGNIDADDNIVWVQNRQVEMWFEDSLPSSYIYDSFDTGWTNCDKFYSYSGDKTTNYVDLSSSPNQNEARIFIVFEEGGLPAVVAFTQNYTDGLQSYVDSLPVGLEVTYIGLTINNNQQYLAVKTVAISEEETIVLPFEAVSTDEIVAALELLN